MGGLLSEGLIVTSSLVRDLRSPPRSATPLFGSGLSLSTPAPDCCHDDVVGLGRRVAARSVTWPLVPVLLVGMVARGAARPGAGQGGALRSHDFASSSSYVVGLIACWLVGVVLTLRVPERGAGWAFLALGTVMAWSGFVDSYTEVALGGRVDDLPAGRSLGDARRHQLRVVVPGADAVPLPHARRPGPRVADGAGCRGSRWRRRWCTSWRPCCARPTLAAPYDDLVSPLAVHGPRARRLRWSAFGGRGDVRAVPAGVGLRAGLGVRPRHTARSGSSCSGWSPAPCRSCPGSSRAFVGLVRRTTTWWPGGS